MQREVQEAADNSHQVRLLRNIQETINSSLQARANSCGKLTTNRKSINRGKPQALQQHSAHSAHAAETHDSTTHPSANKNETTQLIEITTPSNYDDGKNNYIFDNAYTIDLTSLLANSIDEEDPGLATFELILRGAHQEYVQMGKHDITSDISEVLTYISDPQSSNFHPAEPGKRISGQDALDFSSIQGTVNELTKSRTDYGKAIQTYSENFKNQACFKSYKKLKELVKPFLELSRSTLNSEAETTSEILQLFHFLMPLHDEVIKGIANKESLMYRIKHCIHQKINALESKTTGTPILPQGSLLRYGATISIGDQSLGTKSEIKTAYPGALVSGEKATARVLETNLSKQYGRPFVAGHLVADSLGGKNISANLTPLTNDFNTSGGSYGIKDPENDALGRLKAGKVIYYSTTVSYNNRSSGLWHTAVRPTHIKVRVANLNLKMEGNAADIGDYTHVSNEAIYNLYCL